MAAAGGGVGGRGGVADVMGLCRSGHFGTVGAGSPAAGGHGSGGVGATHVVVGQWRRRDAGAVGVGRGHPSMAMDVVVVGPCISGTVGEARVGVVGRDAPSDGGDADLDTEAQVLGCVVHAAGAVEPNAMQVEGHVDFVAGVGVETVDPNLVVGGVDALHPDFVDEYVGLNLVIVSAVNHQLVLGVEIVDGACGLAVGEVVDGPSGRSYAHQDHNYNQCNAFHGFGILGFVFLNS